MTAYDLYDVLAELGYGMNPRTREQRAEAFGYKNKGWLAKLPAPAAHTLQALARQFIQTGTEALENPHVFSVPEVARAGGLASLKTLGKPAEILMETKERIFAV